MTSSFLLVLYSLLFGVDVAKALVRVAWTFTRASSTHKTKSTSGNGFEKLSSDHGQNSSNGISTPV